MTKLGRTAAGSGATSACAAEGALVSRGVLGGARDAATEGVGEAAVGASGSARLVRPCPRGSPGSKGDRLLAQAERLALRLVLG